MAGAVEWLPFAFRLAKDVEKLTEFLYSGIQESAHFGSGIEKARLSLRMEAVAFKSIKSVLFGGPDEQPSGRGLFSEFNLHTQLDIINVLRYFKDTLQSKFKVVGREFGAEQPNINEITNESVNFGSYHAASLISKLRWGFVEKARMEKVIRELRSWNERLLGIIQLQLIRTAAGSNAPIGGKPSKFIERLQDAGLMGEADSLGLSNDVQLARISCDLPRTFPSSLPVLEILDKSRYSLAPVLSSSTSWRLINLSENLILLEFKEFASDDTGRPSSVSVERIRQLTNILHEKKAGRYHTLICRGYYIHEGNFVLAFDIPKASSPQFSNLHSLLQTHKMPDLEERFLLARQLAMALSQFHAVGWVHKSFRSNNILFFPPDHSLGQENQTSLEDPYLSGWEYSRPASEFSSRLNDNDELEANIYRHPDQWGLPTVRFNKFHDIYSLGVVLLEIGLWKPALSLHRTQFRSCELGSYVQNYFLDSARHQRLRSQMGRRYQNIVLGCLQGIFGSSSILAASSNGDAGSRDLASIASGALAQQDVISSEDFNSEVCYDSSTKRSFLIVYRFLMCLTRSYLIYSCIYLYLFMTNSRLTKEVMRSMENWRHHVPILLRSVQCFPLYSQGS